MYMCISYFKYNEHVYVFHNANITNINVLFSGLCSHVAVGKAKHSHHPIRYIFCVGCNSLSFPDIILRFDFLNLFTYYHYTTIMIPLPS